MAAPGSRRCATCPFKCPGVCDAVRSRALRAAVRLDPPAALPDETLVRRHLDAAAAGAPSPYLGVLFERHYRYVIAAICRITGRFDMAGDLTQDVFIKALLHIDRFRLDASFTTWLFAIARNCCYDYAKTAAVRREILVDPADMPAAPIENAALRRLEQQEARRILLRLMKDARLEAVEAKAFGLHYAGDVPLDVLTGRLGLENRSGAKAKIVSARRKLHRAVQRWQGQARVSSWPRPQATMTPWRMA